MCNVWLRCVRDGDNRSVDDIRGDINPDRATERRVETSARLVASRRVPHDRPGHVQPARAFQVCRRSATHPGNNAAIRRNESNARQMCIF